MISMISCPTGKVSYINVLLFNGRNLDQIEEWKTMMRRVAGPLVKNGSIEASDTDLVEEIVEDIIAPKISSWNRARELRERILWKARFSSKSNNACLRELRRAVVSRINWLRYRHQRRIYRQVAAWAVSLEKQGILQSNMPGTVRKGAVKIIGLQAWGIKWRDRIPVNTLYALKAFLPMIPLYRRKQKEGREAKIFAYRCLQNYEPLILKEHGGPMTLGDMTEVIEGLLSPQPSYRIAESSWPETLWEEQEEGGSAPSPKDMLACADVFFEDNLINQDIEDQLRKKATSEEQFVFDGLGSGKSKRKLAILSGCSPGTIEKRRLQLVEKAAPLDPVVATVHARHLTY